MSWRRVSARTSTRSRSSPAASRLGQDARHFRDRHRAGPEAFDHQAEPCQRFGMFEQQRNGVAVEFDDDRDEQSCRAMPPAARNSLQLFVDDALVGGVLVDDDDAVLGLGHDIGFVQLRAGSTEGCGAVLGVHGLVRRPRIRGRPAEMIEGRLLGLGEALSGARQARRASPSRGWVRRACRVAHVGLGCPWAVAASRRSTASSARRPRSSWRGAARPRARHGSPRPPRPRTRFGSWKRTSALAG